MKTVTFFKQFLKKPLETGALFPSSTALGKEMIAMTKLKEADVVVEIGPGNGVFTKEIVESLKPGASFFAIEFNKDFAELTRKAVPGVQVYIDTAEHINKYLDEQGKGKADVIISALPWAWFSETHQESLLSALWEALKPGGMMSSVAFVHGLPFPPAKKFKDLLPKYFSEVGKTKVVWENFPPAMAYLLKK